MKRTIRTTAILFLVAACVLFVFSGVFVNTTYAVLPTEYESEVADNDWYFGENFLNLASLKTTVASWFEDDRVYDFAAIERAPIVVAVIDSGINYNHQLFTGKYDENGVAVETSDAGEYDVLLRDAEGNLICKNTVVGKGYSEDDIIDDAPDRHGTHVAGIVATLIHELNLEKYIKILPIKAAYPVDKDDESKGSSFLVDAINAAIEFALENGADVVNMSLTSTLANDSDFEKLVTNSMAEDAVFVGAAGNNGKCNSINIFGNKVNYYYPAASQNVIGVMNLTHDDKIKDYELYSTSNYGSAYDLAAAGYQIWSADGKTNNGYKPLKGTSMATPIVSFGAALATLKYAAIAAATGEVNAKTPREIANIIKSSYSGTLTYNKTSLRVFDMNVFAATEGMYSLYIDCDAASLNQTQGEVKAVSFSAMLLPINYDNDVYSNNIRWYVQIGEEETELGVGKNITYTPENLAGDYKIIAKYEYEHDFVESKTITVGYVKPSAEDSVIEKPDNATDFVIGKTYTFNIENYENYSETDVVVWYVNGEYAKGGAGQFVFEFVPEEAGSYEITVKINGQALNNKVEFEIAEEPFDVNMVYTYVSIGIAGGILLAIGIVVAVYFAKKKSRKAL